VVVASAALRVIREEVKYETALEQKGEQQSGQSLLLTAKELKSRRPSVKA